MSHRSRSLLAEPCWLPLARADELAPPPAVRHWLLDQGSLTRALTDACGGDFRVHLCRQGWGRALASEQRLLDIPPRIASLLREVKLLCNQRPCVFARTLLPASSLRGPARRLARLRNRPLGAVLFADPRTRREQLQVACLTPEHDLFRRACSHLDGPGADLPERIWGRRTLFSYAGRPLLVNEIFLPAIFEL